MARWINQTLNVNRFAQIILEPDQVLISGGDPEVETSACFHPVNRDDANAMAIALRLAAKRLEDIGKVLA